VAFLAKDKAMAGATGDVVVTSSTDKSIRFWDLNTRKQLHTIPLPQTPYNVQVSPDGQWLAFSVGKIAQIWSIKQGKLQYSHSIQGHQDAIKHLKFTNNGAGLVTSGYDKAIFLWNTQSGKKLLTLEDKLDPIQQAPGIDVNSSGSLIIVTDYSTQLVRTMSLSTGEVFQRYVTPNGATVATFLKDGSAFLYARTASATIDIWFFLGKPNLVFEGTGHTGVVQFLEAHPKGPWVASAGTDTTIHVWRVPQDDTDKGALVKVLKDHQSRIMALGFSPDGTKLVSSSFVDRKVIVWGCPTE
jgi:WD40 repeat protein